MSTAPYVSPLPEGMVVIDTDQPDDNYTTEPTHLRIYWEDHGDEYPWCLDAVDDEHRYTEDVRRYETFEQAVNSIDLFIADGEHDGVTFKWNAERPRRGVRRPKPAEPTA